jgi:predicted cupin superfamily sugar epimerase
MPDLTAEEIIQRLGLEPLNKEGGYFRQTWRSACRIPDGIPGSEGFAGGRAAGTAIYFLITTDQFSAMHRLKGDEIWLHHFGDPLDMLVLHPDGRGELASIGPELSLDQCPQHLCPANCWQGTHIAPGQDRFGYTLGSCVMAPGFEWSDFELGDRNRLVRQYPEFAQTISDLTRP